MIYLTWAAGSAWYLLLAPFGVSATHQFAELATRGVAEGARQRIRSHRESLVTNSLTAPLAQWLAEWPTTGGTSFEKLQQVLRRVPDSDPPDGGARHREGEGTGEAAGGPAADPDAERHGHADMIGVLITRG